MPEGFIKFSPCCLEIHLGGFASGDDIQIHIRNMLPVASEDFPDIPLEPVADYGAADLFADRDSEAGLVPVVGLPHYQKPFDGELAR